MTYIRLDDDHPTNPKVADLTDSAYRRWVYLISACSRHLTDGRVSDGLFRDIVPAKKIRDELVDGGFVYRNGTGWVVHDYLEHQRSKAEIRAATNAARTAARIRWASEA